jgi:hypothetical protein
MKEFGVIQNPISSLKVDRKKIKLSKIEKTILSWIIMFSINQNLKKTNRG